MLYESAAKGSDRRRELRAKAKVMAQLRRADTDAELSGDAPRRAVQQLFKAGLCGSKAAEKIPALLTSGAAPEAVAAAREALFRAVCPALESAREDQVPPLRIADGAMLADFKLEGDAATGYRVRVSGEKLGDSQWQVAMEQGQARIVPPAAPAAAHDDPAWARSLPAA